ncbi:MAG: DUF58 domain-containing protein [Verrucomicrobiota bacterium]|nr:DUF58 domain-containing protein [Verrucomicrobiota bacterium]
MITAPRERFLDVPSLMTIRNLELRAKVVVEGFWNGLHRSPYHGFSVEFTEYRQYTPGDDPRYLDWRLFARSDRYYIKKFEDETNLRCLLMVDQSRSMLFGSGSYSKNDYAHTLAATLAYFLFEQGDAVGLMAFHERIQEYLPVRNRPGHLRQIMLALEKPAAGKETNLALPLKRVSEMVRKRGMFVMISDFLTPLEEFASALRLLAASGNELLLFQVLDPAEVIFNLEKVTLFQDRENERELFIDPAQARGGYLARFNEHQLALRQIAQGLGAHYQLLRTDQLLQHALLEFLQRRV